MVAAVCDRGKGRSKSAATTRAVPAQDRFSGFQNPSLPDMPPFTMKTQSISRPQFLKPGTAATIAATTPAKLFAAGECGGHKIPFGLQLFSVRDECAKD